MSTENIELANQYYGTVKTLTKDLKKINSAKANLALEFARDALNLYGSTNHEKKAELREIIRVIEELIPPRTFKDLSITIQSIILRIFYPKNYMTRNLFLGVTALIMICSVLFPLRGTIRHFFISKPIELTGEIEDLPKDQVLKLNNSEVKVFWSNDNFSNLHCEFYNGSDYELQEITALVRVKEEGITVWEKNVMFPLNPQSSGKPFETSKFTRGDKYEIFPEWIVRGPLRATKGAEVVAAKGIRVNRTQ